MQILCDREQDGSIIWKHFIIWQISKILPILWNVKHGTEHSFFSLYPWLWLPGRHVWKNYTGIGRNYTGWDRKELHWWIAEYFGCQCDVLSSTFSKLGVAVRSKTLFSSLIQILRRGQAFFKPQVILTKEAWNSGTSRATNLLPNTVAREDQVWRSLGKFARWQEKVKKGSGGEAEPSHRAMTPRWSQSYQTEDLLQNPVLSRTSSRRDQTQPLCLGQKIKMLCWQIRCFTEETREWWMINGKQKEYPTAQFNKKNDVERFLAD